LSGVRQIYIRMGCLLARLPYESIETLQPEDQARLVAKYESILTHRLRFNGPIQMLGRRMPKLTSLALEQLRRETKEFMESLADRRPATLRNLAGDVAIVNAGFANRDFFHASRLTQAGGRDKTRKRLDPSALYLGAFRSEFLMNIVSQMHEVGFSAVHRCPQCRKVFIQRGKKMYCSRRCVETSKSKRYSQSADYRLSRAFGMMRRAWVKTHNGTPPSADRNRKWFTDYRDKLLKHGRPAPKQSVKEFLEFVVER
jgi:hypothetical protein